MPVFKRLLAFVLIAFIVNACGTAKFSGKRGTKTDSKDLVPVSAPVTAVTPCETTKSCPVVTDPCATVQNPAADSDSTNQSSNVVQNATLNPGSVVTCPITPAQNTDAGQPAGNQDNPSQNG